MNFLKRFLISLFGMIHALALPGAENFRGIKIFLLIIAFPFLLSGVACARAFPDVDLLENALLSNASQSTGTSTAPSLVLTGSTDVTVSESGTSDSFFIKLSSRPTADVTVCLSVDDYCQATISTSQGNVSAPGASCSGAKGELVFTTSNWSNDQQVVVEGRHDADYTTVMGASLPEGGNCDSMTNFVGDATFQISTSVVSSDTSYGGLSVSPITGTTKDDRDRYSFNTASYHSGDFDHDPALSTGPYSATNGDGNGIDEADNFCMSQLPASLTGTGNYRAMIVDGVHRIACVNASCSPADASDATNWVLSENTLYFRSDGVTRALQTNSSSPLFVFNAATSNGFETGGGAFYWTGLNTNWTGYSDSCASAAGTTGWDSVGPAVSDAGWPTKNTTAAIYYVTSASCNSSYSLICIQQ